MASFRHSVLVTSMLAELLIEKCQQSMTLTESKCLSISEAQVNSTVLSA